MSTITFMIGNGFDLACGLKSRYKDTYNGYIKTEPSSDAIESFQKTIEKDIETWADFEMKMADYAKSLHNERELAECIQDYSGYLFTYLTHEQTGFLNMFHQDNDSFHAICAEMAKSLYYFYEGLTPKNHRRITSVLSDGTNRRYQFICYNYTNVFDETVTETFSKGYINAVSEKGCINKGIIHIHGKLGEDLVLGVDNESQLSELPYKLSNRGKRNILKPAFLEDYDDKRRADALSYIESSDVVCIFGLALGDSDLSWKNAIADWLLKDARHHLVYYCHRLSQIKYPPTAVMRKMDDEEDYREELIDRLFGETDVAEKNESLRKQIHIPVGTTIFNIDSAKYVARLQAVKKQQIKASTTV